MWLGINYAGMHDSSITLLDERGSIQLAISEERLSRVKKDGRFPHHSLALVDMNQVQKVGIPYLRTAPVPPAEADPLFEGLLPIQIETNPLPAWRSFPVEWHSQLKQLTPPHLHFDHHEGHAAAGYYLSGMRDAYVLTSDGGSPNCNWSATLYHATPQGLEFLHGASLAHYRALSLIYSNVTALLGYKPIRHEGKITGLAAYGEDNPACEEALWDVYREISERKMSGTGLPLSQWANRFSDKAPYYQSNPEVIHYFRQQRLGQFSDEDLARAVQNIITDKTLTIVRRIIDQYNPQNLVLSGGIFANVKLNQDIKKLGIPNVFVCPPMSDEGLSLGGAVLAWSHETGGSLYQGPVRNMFMGVTIEEDVPAELDKLGVVYEHLDDVPETVAQLLAEGKIIALVRGAMEFGPRALGNRSILYQANDPTVNQWLNERLRRTEFMPFAPIVCAEDADRLFKQQGLHGAEHTAEFMTICFDCTKLLREQCPAIVHIDDTARPQLVTQENQPSLHRILTRYQELTGLPALINTSFNMHEEPIVAYAREAVIAFLQSQLDCLVIENYLVDYHANAHALETKTVTVNNIPRH